MTDDGTLPDRLRNMVRNPNAIGTHSAACWQWHDDCALLLAADRVAERDADVSAGAVARTVAMSHIAAERDAERAARERAEAEARQLREAIGDRHTPEEQQAEVWWGDADHDQRFPHCPSGDDCEGHVTTITVCSECGYTHDGETPIFRQWPCPTLAAAVAEGAEDRGQTHTQNKENER